MKLKRFLSLAVSLAMVLAMVPAFSLTASAASTTTVINALGGEVVWSAPDGDYNDTAVATAWSGWSSSVTAGNVNVKTYENYETLQFYGGGNNLNLSVNASDAVKSGTTGAETVIIEWKQRATPNASDNYYDFTFKDINGTTIAFFKMDKNFTAADYTNTKTGDYYAMGFPANYTPMAVVATNNADGTTHTVEYYVNGFVVATATLDGAINGFGSIAGSNGSWSGFNHIGFADLTIGAASFSETKVDVTATYTVNGETVKTATKAYDTAVADGAVFDALAYSANGSNVLYATDGATLSESDEIALEAVANAGKYKKGDIFANDGVQYEVKSDNLIPNGDFAYGLAGWYGANNGALNTSNFRVNDNGTVTSIVSKGTSDAGSLHRAWAIEDGKTYVFVQDNDTAGEYHKFSLTNEICSEETMVIDGYNATGTSQKIFTNNGYAYAQIKYRWTTATFGNFGLYEIAEAETVVTEEVDSYTIPAVKVIGDTEVVLPATVKVTGSLGSEVTGTIEWNDAPATYPVGNTTVNGTMTVKFGEQEATIEAVSTTVTVLEETFTIADSASKSGQPGNVVYFPVDIADEFTIEFDMNIVRRTDVSVQMGYDGTMFGAGALGISPNGGVFKVTGGSKNGTAGISHDLFASVNNGDIIHVLLTMDASDGTYSLTARKADGEMATVSEQGFRQAQSAINTMTLVTNGNGTMGDTAADGDITVSNIKVNANISKTEYTIYITKDGDKTSTTASYWTEAEALAAIADIDGYEKKVTVEGTTINVVYSATQILTVTFVDAEENTIKSVSEEVAIGETYTVNAEEIFYIDSNDVGHIYQIPETVLSATNSGSTFTVSEAANKYAVIYDAFVTGNELWGTTEPDSANSIFVATSRDVNGAPIVDANGVAVTDGRHTPSGLGSSRVGFFQFPVVELQEGQKATAVFGVRSWHSNTFSNSNTSIRFAVTAINDTAWTEGANGSTYDSANAPVLEGWSTPVFSNVATQADTELVFDVTEIMAAAKEAGLSTITLRVNASWGAAYIADREEAVAGGQYEGQASYIEVSDAGLVKVTETGYAELTKNGSAMNGFAYVAATDDVRLNAADAVVVGTDNGYYEANKTLSFTEAADLGTTAPAGLGLAMVNGAQVRIGATELEDGAKLDAMADSGLRFIATADYNNTLIADEAVEFGIKIQAESSDQVAYVKATKFQDGDNTVFSAAITNMKESNYNRKYTATAYAKVPMADGTTLELTAGEVTRSIYQVSAGIMKNGSADAEGAAYTVDGVVKNILNAYVNQTGIRLSYTDNGITVEDGKYTGDEFFTVTSESDGDDGFNVTIAPDTTWGTPAEIATWWTDYVRFNNNNSVAKGYISDAVFADGVLTFNFDATVD